MSSYREVVKQMSGDDRIACRFCGKPTLVETLSQYGARCFECYEAYCAEASSGPVPQTRSEKFALLSQMRKVLTQPKRDPKQWAHDLKARDEAGESLTNAQRMMYRGALGRGVTDAEMP